MPAEQNAAPIILVIYLPWLVFNGWVNMSGALRDLSPMGGGPDPMKDRAR